MPDTALTQLSGPSAIKRYVEDGNAVEEPSKRHKSFADGLEKHPHYWDELGNVVVQVEATLFKLHGPNLSRQSVYFEELFRCKSDEFKGLPMHFVSSTDVKDLEVLLFALENAVTFFTESPSFDTIASLLRVSTSLKFPKFRNFAVHSLTNAWPDDLDKVADDGKWLKYAAETVTLARDYDVPSLLKRALYELLRTPGFTKTDADISQHDLRLLGKAREELSAAWLSIVIVEHHSCVRTTKQCRGFFKQPSLLHGIIRYMHDPIVGLEYLQKCADGLWTSTICGSCKVEKARFWKETRTSIWAKLDLWLELKIPLISAHESGEPSSSDLHP